MDFVLKADNERMTAGTIVGTSSTGIMADFCDLMFTVFCAMKQSLQPHFCSL